MSEADDAQDSRINSDPAKISVETGGIDVYSKLPHEVHIEIWSHCRPQELLSLCRTTKWLRAYLIQRSAEDIWKSARKAQAVVIDQVTGVHFHPSFDTQDTAPWPHIYSIPDPPFHLNEFSWADYLFGKRCPYCSSYDAYQQSGTYHRACDTCKAEGSPDIKQIKLDYKDMGVDIRLYSILPHSSLGYSTAGQPNRRFWKPTCDKIRQEMARFQANVAHDEGAIRSYVEIGRQRVRELLDQSNAGTSLEYQFSSWKQAKECLYRFKSDERVTRNTAMFPHSMRDTELSPADLADFCRSVPRSDTRYSGDYPYWLNSDAVLFDHASAKSEVAKNSTRLEKIRDFRLAHEAYVAQAADRALVLELVEEELQRPEQEDCWRMDRARISMVCANQLPDLLQLPRVKAIVAPSGWWEEQAESKRKIWRQEWPEIRAEIGAMTSQWLTKMTDLVKGPLGRDVAFMELDKRVFSCSRCKSKYLFHPDVLSHSCFNMVVNSPNYSDELARPLWKGGNGRLKPLDLTSLVYNEASTLKLRILMAAIRQAGSEHVPSALSELSTIAGSFSCEDCPANSAGYYDTMSWQTAAGHLLETTKYPEYQEDGEWENKPTLHLHLRYNPTVPVAAPF